MIEPGYKVAIGLEVHVQLSTDTKLFCDDSNEFGLKENTQVGLVSLAYPGTLPVLNENALEMAIRLAIACNSEIPPITLFDRKNYFYPDLPKGYQITQDRAPVAVGGYIPVGDKKVQLTKMHLEEDAGKSIHTDGANYSLIDYNRAGTPLVEIVTEPVIVSAAQAGKVFSTVRKLVRYLEVSDGNMEHGSLRCDVNISLSKTETLGSKVEIKNLNSIRFVQKAIEFEIKRQTDLLDSGKEVISETRLFDSVNNSTSSMREKETLNDYRYFPDPDLPGIELRKEFIDRVRNSMSLTPWEAQHILKTKYLLPDYDAAVISEEKELFKYYCTAAESCANYKLLANWIMGPVKNYINDTGDSDVKFPFNPEKMAELIEAIDRGKVTKNAAQKVLFPEMIGTLRSVGELITDLGLAENKEDELTLIIDELSNEFPKEWSLMKSGQKKLIGMFMGQVMKRTGGKADPAKAKELLMNKIG